MVAKIGCFQHDAATMNASPLASALGRVFRGAAGLVFASMIWSVLIPQNGEFFMRLLFGRLSSAWVVFPVGAALSWLLPRYVARRRFLVALGMGLLVGIIASLVVTTGLWLWFNHQGLTGLVTNRHSQGYASYSYSIRVQLRDAAWRMLLLVAPVVTIWVTGWAIWINRSLRSDLNPIASIANPPTVLLRLNWRALQLFIFGVIGLGVFATIALLITSLFSGKVQVPFQSFVLVGPAAVGLVVFGPWLGPVINPGGGGHSIAWQFTAVALPILICSFIPFLLTRRPIKLGMAVSAWCGLVTALLFWMGVGVWSLGWSLG